MSPIQLMPYIWQYMFCQNKLTFKTEYLKFNRNYFCFILTHSRSRFTVQKSSSIIIKLNFQNYQPRKVLVCSTPSTLIFILFYFLFYFLLWRILLIMSYLFKCQTRKKRSLYIFLLKNSAYLYLLMNCRRYWV